MAKVSTYLNFEGKTEEAFEFYRSVFGGEFVAPGISRYGGMPGAETMPDDVKHLVVNVALSILGGHTLMGTDALQGMGQPYTSGNDVSICLHPDSKEEADALFAALSIGGTVEMPMADQFWGDYYGAFTDQFGKSWMINYTPE